METLPVSIIQNKIIYFLSPDVYCDIDSFLNLKLINKFWYSLVNNTNTWFNFMKKNNHKIRPLYEENMFFINYVYSSCGVFNERNRTYYFYNELDWQEDIDSDGETIYVRVEKNHQRSKILIPYSKENKIELKLQNTFLRNHIRYSLLTFYPNEITSLFSVEDFFKIPELKELKADYLDNMMGIHYDEFESYITSGIMRGFDTKNRPYLVFRYKDIKNDITIVETIYFKYNLICNPEKKHGWTFTGRYNLTYIGLLADKDRKLSQLSMEYIQRLIKGEKCEVNFPKYEDGEITIYKTVSNENLVYLLN